MIDNTIIVNHCSYSILKAALSKWISENKDQASKASLFEIHSPEAQRHIIKISAEIDNKLFLLLVLGLGSSEDAYGTLNVIGFTNVNNNSVFTAEPSRKPVMMFVSKDVHDTVHAVTADNKGYNISINGIAEATEATRTYYEPIIGNSKPVELISAAATIKKKDKGRSLKAKGEERFTIISVIIIIAYIINLLVQIKNPSQFLFNHFMLGGAFATWLFIDYTLLQVDELFYKSLVLALLLLGYGYFVFGKYETYPDLIYLTGGVTLPFTFLVLQRVFRFIFILFLDREPKVEEKSGFWNSVYFVVLMLSPVFLSLFWVSKLFI
jgi:hypothetical protein